MGKNRPKLARAPVIKPSSPSSLYVRACSLLIGSVFTRDYYFLPSQGDQKVGYRNENESSKGNENFCNTDVGCLVSDRGESRSINPRFSEDNNARLFAVRRIIVQLKIERTLEDWG